MALQSAPIQIQPAFGIAGEQAFNNPPIVALPWNIVSASAAYNIVGATGFSITSAGTAPTAAAGNTTGSLPFAGILVLPKNYANYNGNLTPTMTLPNNALVSLATVGSFNLILTNTPSVGDQVYMDNTTGALTSIAAGSVLPSGKTWINGTVQAYDATSSGGIAVVLLTGPVPVSYVAAS